MKILSPAHPAKIRIPSEDLATCAPGQDFKAYLAKFKAAICTKFSKDGCRAIAITGTRLGTGQRNSIASSFCDDPIGLGGHRVLCRSALGNAG